MNRQFAAFASLAGFALIPVPLAAIGSMIPMGAIWAYSGFRYALLFFLMLVGAQIQGLIQDWTMLYMLGLTTYHISFGSYLAFVTSTGGMLIGVVTLFLAAKEVRNLVLVRLGNWKRL